MPLARTVCGEPLKESGGLPGEYATLAVHTAPVELKAYRVGSEPSVTITTVASRSGHPVVDVYAASKSPWGRPEFVSDDGSHLTTSGNAAVADPFDGVMHAQGALPSHGTASSIRSPTSRHRI